MKNPSPEDLKEEKDAISDIHDFILDRYPDYDERPERIQEILEEVGARWNEIEDMLYNHDKYGSYEAPETKGSSVSVHDSIHTGHR